MQPVWNGDGIYGNPSLPPLMDLSCENTAPGANPVKGKPPGVFFADLQYFVSAFLRGPFICVLCVSDLRFLYISKVLAQTKGIMVHKLSLGGKRVS